MRKRLLVLAALGVLPVAQAHGQRARAKKDSASTVQATLGMASGLAGGLLSLVSSSRGGYGSSTDGWCVGSCGNGNRSNLGFFLTSESSQGNARVGAASLLLHAAPARRAMLLESLDDALTRAGLRIVGGKGNRVWFGTDDSNTAFDGFRSELSADQSAVGASESFAGTGVVQARAEQSAGPVPSTGCIIASCMLGESRPVDVIDGASSTTGARFVPDATQESLFDGAPAGIAPALDGDVNTIVNPEPGTIVLMVGGLAGLVLVRRRTRGASR